MVVIAIIVSIGVYYFDLVVFTFPILVGAITVWLIFTPYKLYDDASE